MKKELDPEELARLVISGHENHPLIMAVLRSGMGRSKLHRFAEEIASRTEATLVRSAYSPNSDISLFEMRRSREATLLLIIRADEERVIAVDATTDEEIAEIESNLYSSNINDVYVRLVSDTF